MDKFKFLLVGSGNIASTYIKAAANVPEIAITGIVSRSGRRPAGADEKLPVYNSITEADCDFDAVILATPNGCHASGCLEAAAIGKHVFTEKPMSINIEDARAMIDVAKENNVICHCVFQNRYNAGALLAKKLLDDGTLGKVISAKCYVTWDRSDEYYGKSDWKGTWDKEGGGVIIDQAIHTLDLMRYLINSPINYVDATITNRGHAKIDVEDTAEGCIAFQNGVLANFHAINYYGYDADVYVELMCENGIAELESDRAYIKMNDGRVFEAERPNEDFGYGNVKSYWGVNHCKQINNFYECLESGEEMFIPVESAYKTMEMVCAIYKSGKTKERVYLNK